jgi:hypothetical protein
VKPQRKADVNSPNKTVTNLPRSIPEIINSNILKNDFSCFVLKKANRA